MLCTDYQKMESEIQEFRMPAYTVQNARAWIAGLKDLINDNIKTLIKRVFQEITDGTYRVGGGWNGTKKKRNNNGIDKNFILDTGDWSSCFGYWSDRPTVTDDLEKVCHLLSGKTLPEKTAKAVMRDEKKRSSGMSISRSASARMGIHTTRWPIRSATSSTSTVPRARSSARTSRSRYSRTGGRHEQTGRRGPLKRRARWQYEQGEDEPG